jgi:hypothetical protein
MRDVSWINMMLPELLWIALLHDSLGDRRAVEIVTAFSRDLRAVSPDHNRTIWAAAGKFSELPSTLLPVLLSEKGTSYANDLRAALASLAAWYPAHPLNVLFDGNPPQAERILLARLKAIVSDLFNRSSRAATMVQATALWLVFDAGRLKVNADLALAQFPRIEDYPKTELSQRIAGSVRATLNSMFGDTDLLASGSDWPVAFWNRGLELEPCETNDG